MCLRCNRAQGTAETLLQHDGEFLVRLSGQIPGSLTISQRVTTGVYFHTTVTHADYVYVETHVHVSSEWCVSGHVGPLLARVCVCSFSIQVDQEHEPRRYDSLPALIRDQELLKLLYPNTALKDVRYISPIFGSDDDGVDDRVRRAPPHHRPHHAHHHSSSAEPGVVGAGRVHDHHGTRDHSHPAARPSPGMPGRGGSGRCVQLLCPGQLVLRR